MTSMIPSSSKFWHDVLILLIFGSSAGAANTYNLDTNLAGASFFDNFNFITGPDPTNGFVNYVSAVEAANLGLAGPGPNGAVYIGVDYSTTLSTSAPGRNSVRISSKQSWTHGLFIADIAHMPGGICGTWPAFWSFGPNWPQSGEIDIIEGVNSNHDNLMSLHTSSDCTIAGSGQTGTLQSNNCDGNLNQNSGCSSTASTDSSYGGPFNAIAGGVYATEWTSQYIKIWFFPRSSIPPDITNGVPDPQTWGTPQANFQGSCDIDTHFANHNLVFDTTFCGDWAANVWTSDPVCSSMAPTCVSYVASNPSAFIDAYWIINSVQVYTFGPAVSSTSTEASPSLSSSQATPISSNPSPSKTPQSHFIYLSCLSTTPSIFTNILTSPNMTITTCLTACASRNYAGVHGNGCGCADDLGDTTVGSCHLPCPGDPLEVCGGVRVVNSLRKRLSNDTADWAWSVYVAEPVGGLEGSSSESVVETGSITPSPSPAPSVSADLPPLSSVPPASSILGVGMAGIPSFPSSSPQSESQFYITILTTTYIDLCTCAANTLTTYTITSTLTICPSTPSDAIPTPATAPAPQIPMLTTTKTCASCGIAGDSAMFILTLPCIEVSTSLSDISSVVVWSNTSTPLLPLSVPTTTTTTTTTTNIPITPAYTTQVAAAVLYSTQTVLPVQISISPPPPPTATATATEHVVHTSTEIVGAIKPTGGGGQTIMGGGGGANSVLTAEGRRNRRFGFGAVVAFLGFAVLVL